VTKEKMWAARFSKALDQSADGFNASISFDAKMYRQDIRGSQAHARMLARQGIISEQEGHLLTESLEGILQELDSGDLAIDPGAEDIHMFVESVLTERLGDVGRKLHTARSRNDQVALDLRMYLRDEVQTVRGQIRELIRVLMEQAEDHAETVMPGYTHLQRAQPVTFGHHLLAYAMMFDRDLSRLSDAVRRMNVSPLGSCALAGTTYPIDRLWVAEQLGFDGITLNSMDGVSDRDFCVELAADFALVMTHLSRLAEEVLLWTSWEFSFAELDDAFTTGSSIMPQKKNSDLAELVRGKTGRVCGDLMTLLVMLKGLPLAYNKDMQEDKEAIFDSLETVQACLEFFSPMIKSMRVHQDEMFRAAGKGFLNATDLADYLTKKGMPFRSAYKVTGQIVARCIEAGQTLEDMPLEEYRAFSDLFDSDLYPEIALERCVRKRTSSGGTGGDSLRMQLDYLRRALNT